MNSHYMKGNGEDPRLHLVLPLDSGRRHSITATVVATAMDDEQQARFEADVQTLLAELIREALQDRRTENVQF